MGGWGWNDEPPSVDARRLFENARRLYDRIGELVEGAPLRVTPELICELHGIATAGEPDPRKPPGRLRQGVETGTTDVTEVETMLSELLEAILADEVGSAGRP